MATGDIGSVLDTLEVDTTVGYDLNIIHVSGDVYACAYGGLASDGFVATFTIDSSGNIGNAVIDSLEFAPDDSVLNPMIINISGDIFAIVYSGTGQTTRIVTVDIDSSGNIGAAVIDSLSVVGSSNSYPRIVAVSGDIYAVDHSEPTGGSHGEVFTIDIDSSGNIGAAEIDTLEYGTDDGVTGDIIHISGTMFAVVTRNSTRGGSVYTFNIAADGTIDNAATDSYEFDSNSICLWFRILNVSGDVYVVTYTDGDGDGFARTFTIASNGTIGTVIDSLEFDSTYAYQPSLTFVSGGVFAVAYQAAAGTSGKIKTFTITSSGYFSSVLGTLEFESAQMGYFWSHIILITGSTVVCVGYQGVDGDGFVKTALVTGGAASVTYPTDAITRATSLKHIYNREAGIYDLEIGLGEVAADFSIPDVELVSKSSSPIEEEAKEVERIAEEAGVTPAIINKLNRMEEQAQIDFPIPTREVSQQAGTGIRTTPEHQRILTEQFEDPMRLIPKGGGGVQEIQDLVAELKGRATPTVSGQFHEAVSGEETSRIITNTPMGKEGLAAERQRMRELQEQGLSREEINRIIAEQ